MYNIIDIKGLEGKQNWLRTFEVATRVVKEASKDKALDQLLILHKKFTWIFGV